MYRVEPPFAAGVNATQLYSPVTLSREWPAFGRLLFIVLCSCIGSIVNGFFIASFIIEHTLRRIGNVFHACVGMADMILTGGVMPISAVVLLSGQWDSTPVCQFLQFLTETSTYSYSMLFTLVAAESYFRLCRKSTEYKRFLSMGIGLVIILVFTIGFALAGVGTYYKIDYDYCRRLHYGNFYFRCATSVIFHAIPFLLTSFCLIASSIQIRRRARVQLSYRRSQQYEMDYSTTNLNIAAYILYVLAWTPYLIVIHVYPDIGYQKYYQCAWIGVCRSMFTSFLYCFMNRSFRRAFAHLFCYCCCKSSLTGPFDSRHRRGLDFRTTRDVRVHIMHQAVNINNPQRGASSSRETQNL